MAKTTRGLLRLDARREGFALATVLLVMIVLTGGVLTAYSLTTTEQWKVDDRQEQVNAFLLAQEGLEKFIGDSRGNKPENDGCTEYDLVGGEVKVCSYLLRDLVGEEPAVWAIRSHASRTGSSVAHLPDAERTVAQIAYWQPAEMDVKASLTGLGGVGKNGNSGQINGIDQCGKEAALPALALPKNPKYDDKHTGVLKTGPGQERIDYLGDDPKDAAKSVNIDWEGIVNGDALVPDAVFTGGSWQKPPKSKEWPIIRYDGNLSGKPDGQGILIVTGNLTINGSADWKGIILVGGALISNGNNTIAGATMAGLNVMLGEYVEESKLDESVLNGNKQILYNSCHIASALEAYASLVPISNAWMDDWPVLN